MDKLTPLINLCKKHEFKSNSKFHHKKSCSISGTKGLLQNIKRDPEINQGKGRLGISNNTKQEDLNHSVNSHKSGFGSHHIRTNSEKIKPTQIVTKNKSSLKKRQKSVSSSFDKKKEERRSNKHASILFTSPNYVTSFAKGNSKKNIFDRRERVPSVDSHKRTLSTTSNKRGKGVHEFSIKAYKVALTRPNSSASKKRATSKPKNSHEHRITAQLFLNPFGKHVRKEKLKKGLVKKKDKVSANEGNAISTAFKKNYEISKDNNINKPIIIKVAPQDINILTSNEQHVNNSPKCLLGKMPNNVKPLPLSSENLKNLRYQKEIENLVNNIRNYFKDHNEAPPTTTEFYRIGRLLGKGAFGKVNLGMHKLTGKMVAIKSIRKDCFTEEDSKKKVMQEFSILKMLKHKSVIRLYETFESKKHILFIVELCAGGDLLNYVRKRRRL